MHMCQIAETDGELIYVKGTDIEASGKVFFEYKYISYIKEIYKR